jgi:F0F1-type ATP synthase assembly protein I
MEQPQQDRGREAVAYQWASRIISISLGMVVPGLLGYFIDRRLGTRAAFTVVGFLLGMALGMWRLINFARQLQNGAQQLRQKK